MIKKTSTNYQQTITKKVSIDGIGLHTGLKSKITFKPAKEDSGINFLRTDVDNCPLIYANVDNVIDIARGTIIAKDVNQNSDLNEWDGGQLGVIVEFESKAAAQKAFNSTEFQEYIKCSGIENQLSLSIIG